MAKAFFVLAVAALALSALVGVRADDDEPYLTEVISFSSTDGIVIDTSSDEVKGYSSWAANLTVTNTDHGALVVRADIYDSDGDAFFAVRVGGNPTAHCILDAQVNLSTDVGVVTVFKQQGLACHVSAHRPDPKKRSYPFSVVTRRTHDEDCNWNGTDCK